ncbi:uncharacterized protein F5891DRAFT_980977 [Suillus fuscotomentosus]|uniref:Uncharacterized protein n=1 Tax=Suillus fuscotomentosus TaxID=1912939 RepID=A0AAD4E4A4_9AGAM|nr:uncharacterized protein F5891DRAFT_980977 [Suillus fuscotomentosus]KAG1899440.1 hypothetical protein F5891DRAFT_980977 [Suillus fuscotomentosus]
MHFSFVVVLTALAACMSVSACNTFEQLCSVNTDCCPDLRCVPSDDQTPLLTSCDANRIVIPRPVVRLPMGQSTKRKAQLDITSGIWINFTGVWATVSAPVNQ